MMEEQNENFQEQEVKTVFIEHENLPNSTAVLVLGILSIVFCWCYGILGVILGIIALVLANKDLKLYKANPEKYSESSYKNLSAGKVTAIIGLSLSGLFLLYVIAMIALYGTLIFSAMEASQQGFPY